MTGKNDDFLSEGGKLLDDLKARIASGRPLQKGDACYLAALIDLYSRLHGDNDLYFFALLHLGDRRGKRSFDEHRAKARCDLLVKQAAQLLIRSNKAACISEDIGCYRELRLVDTRRRKICSGKEEDYKRTIAELSTFTRRPKLCSEDSVYEFLRPNPRKSL